MESPQAPDNHRPAEIEHVGAGEQGLQGSRRDANALAGVGQGKDAVRVRSSCRDRAPYPDGDWLWRRFGPRLWAMLRYAQVGPVCRLESRIEAARRPAGVKQTPARPLANSQGKQPPRFKPIMTSY